MTLLATAMGLWWGALVALLLGSAILALLQPWAATRRARNHETPPVSVLVPLREAKEARSIANASIFGLDYPDFEVLFAVKEAGSGKAQEDGMETARHAARFIETSARAGRNPKIANLIDPVEKASYDFLLIKDAGTVLAPGTLAAMMRSFMPGAGLVCAVPIAREPGCPTATVEACLINTYGARLLLAASCLGLGPGIGAAMLLDRRALRAAGGLEAIATAIADDHALARLLARGGLSTALAGVTVDQHLGPRRFADVWRRHLRWAVCRRIAEPAAFYAEPFIGLAAACLAAWLGAGWLGVPRGLLLAVTLVLWPLAEMGLARLKGWPVTIGMPFAIVLRELLMPALWLSALLTRRIAWGSTHLPVARVR